MTFNILRTILIIVAVLTGASKLAIGQHNCTDTISIGGGTVLWSLPDSVQPIIYVPDETTCDGFFISGRPGGYMPVGDIMNVFVQGIDTMEVISLIGRSGFDFVDKLPFKKGRYRLSFKDVSPVQKRGDEFLNSNTLENTVLATWWNKEDVKYNKMKDISFNCYSVGVDGFVLKPLGPDEW